MGSTVVADTGFLVALLRKRDVHREWATALAREYPRPWHTCEAVLSETFHILPPLSRFGLAGLLGRRAVLVSFSFGENSDAVLRLMRKYADLPAEFADACLVRMTELLPNPVVLTTDDHFRVYRRHNREVVPCKLPA